MKAYQMLAAIQPDLFTEILTHLHTNHRPAYLMVMNTLATQRRLRPIFLQKKTKQQQFVWLTEQLRIKPNNEVAEQVVQLWLLKGQQKMLGTFLDAVGIEHKEGEVDTLPETISEAKGKAGIDALLAEFSADRAALYLHMFQMQSPNGFDGLAKAIAAEPKLQLGKV
jgi:hypothetical protein